jgi:hypothetical protein
LRCPEQVTYFDRRVSSYPSLTITALHRTENTGPILLNYSSLWKSNTNINNMHLFAQEMEIVFVIVIGEKGRKRLGKSSLMRGVGPAFEEVECEDDTQTT